MSVDRSTKVGRNPARVLPAPVGATSNVERPFRALWSNSSWCVRGCHPRVANHELNVSGRTTLEISGARFMLGARLSVDRGSRLYSK